MDRKALKQEYRNMRHAMGAYRVHNTLTNKSFVGTSANLRAALNGQLARLRGNVHQNAKLQSDWNELGEGAFAFEILDELQYPDRPDYDPKEDLRVLEELWMDKLSPFEERGYHAMPKKKE